MGRSRTARYLSDRYMCLATETAQWASMELDEECRGVGNVLEESIKEILGEAGVHIMFYVVQMQSEGES